MTKTYILTQLVTATPHQDGFRFKDEDGVERWVSAETFSKIALEIPCDARGSLDSTKVSLDMVNGFLAKFEDAKLGEKTAVVTATCKNGFEITETASPVEASNYDHVLGVDLCKKRIVDRAFGFLGFLLQTARNGVAGR